MRVHHVAFALFVAGVRIAEAQTPPAPLGDTVSAYRLRLLGVYDAETGDALSGAAVTNVQTGVSSPTNASGLVRLLFLPDGGGLVRITKIGYAPVTRFVSITAADTAPVTELLAKAVPTLPTVTTSDSSPKYISPALRGFEERRHQGFGHFITEATLRKLDESSFDNVIGRMPGLMISCGRRSTGRGGGVGPRGCWAMSAKPGPHGMCDVMVLLDGIPQGTDEANLLLMKTRDFGAVEFYSGPAEVPPQFNATGSACGVLLLWTRER